MSSKFARTFMSLTCAGIMAVAIAGCSGAGDEAGKPATQAAEKPATASSAPVEGQAPDPSPTPEADACTAGDSGEALGTFEAALLLTRDTYSDGLQAVPKSQSFLIALEDFSGTPPRDLITADNLSFAYTVVGENCTEVELTEVKPADNFDNYPMWVVKYSANSPLVVDQHLLGRFTLETDAVSSGAVTFPLKFFDLSHNTYVNEHYWRGK